MKEDHINIWNKEKISIMSDEEYNDSLHVTYSNQKLEDKKIKKPDLAKTNS